MTESKILNLYIREGRLDDAEAITQFQIAMARETEDKTLDPDIVLPAVKKVFSDSNKGFYLVATDGDEGAVVGSLLVTDEWSDWRDSYLWYFQSVFVDNEFRGRGVFKQLYNRVLEMAREQDVLFLRLYVETENESAQKVYESLGMKKMPYYMYDIRIRD